MENVVIEFDHIVIGEFIDGLEDNFFNPHLSVLKAKFNDGLVVPVVDFKGGVFAGLL